MSNKLREAVELMVEMAECPKCLGGLSIKWSPCYDPDCCGIDDRIECEECGWDREGYFQEITFEDFERIVPKKECVKGVVERLRDELRQKTEELEEVRQEAAMFKNDCHSLKRQLKHQRKDLVPDLLGKIKRLESELEIYHKKYGSL